jgi:predicted ATPase
VRYEAGSKIPYRQLLGSGHKETNLHTQIKQDKHKRVTGYVAEAFKLWKVYHFHDTSSEANVKQIGDIDDNQAFRTDASNLAAFLYLLQKKFPGHFNKIGSTIRLIAPFFDRFDLKPLALNESKIRLEWRHKGTDQYFNAYHLSDGTLRVICLATLLLQPEPPGTILIDEPELGLPPYALQVLASLIKSAATKAQIVISTQSVTLINHFKAEKFCVPTCPKTKSRLSPNWQLLRL